MSITVITPRELESHLYDLFDLSAQRYRENVVPSPLVVVDVDVHDF